MHGVRRSSSLKLQPAMALLSVGGCVDCDADDLLCLASPWVCGWTSEWVQGTHQCRPVHQQSGAVVGPGLAYVHVS